jgi:sec-independent protein translocase protein TatA
MFSGLESPMHLLVLGLIALELFGPRRLPELGGSLGRGLREFKRALEGEED